MICDARIAKLRVVFGTSCKMRDGISLSDQLLIGVIEVAAGFAVHNCSVAAMMFCTCGEYVENVPANVG